MVDLSFDKINDFVRARKLCAVPNIQMKTSPPIAVDDANENSVADDGANEYRITSSESDESCESSSGGIVSAKRRYFEGDSSDSDT